MAALHAPLTLRAVTHLDVEAAHDRAHLGDFFLILRCHAGHFDHAATVRTRRRDRRRMRLVLLGRTPPARLPAIACTGPPSGTPAAPLRSVLGKGSRLPEARAARGIELLLEPFTVPLPAIPVAVDLRQVPAQPRNLPVLLLDARVPRIILTLGRVQTLGHTPLVGTGAPNLQSLNADLRRDPLNKDRRSLSGNEVDFEHVLVGIQ